MKSRLLLILTAFVAVFGTLALTNGQATAPVAVVTTQPAVLDDAPTLQRKINAAIAAHAPLVLPARQYHLASTVTIDAAGLVIQGAGTPVSSLAQAGGWAAKQTGTELIWTGPAGGPMLDLHPSIGCTFRDLVFADSTAASTLVRQANVVGFGSGNTIFEHVCFAGANLGLQLGESPTDFNCADVKLNHVVFNQCRTGLRTLNDQCVNVDLTDVTAVWYDVAHPCTVVDLVRGGNFSWHGGGGTLAGASTVLRIAGAGDNAGIFTFADQRWEHQGDYPVLIDASQVGGTCRITAREISDSSGPFKNPANPAPGCFRVGPGVALSVSGSVFQRAVASMTAMDAAGRHSSLAVRDSTLPAPLSKLVKTDGSGFCRWRGTDNSSGWNNLPWADEAGN